VSVQDYRIIHVKFLHLDFNMGREFLIYAPIPYPTLIYSLFSTPPFFSGLSDNAVDGKPEFTERIACLVRAFQEHMLVLHHIVRCILCDQDWVKYSFHSYNTVLFEYAFQFLHLIPPPPHQPEWWRPICSLVIAFILFRTLIIRVSILDFLLYDL